MERKAVAAVLRHINDHTSVHAYGNGVLVDLPMRHGDGDGVRLLVEPVGDVYRVTDRGAAADRLLFAGINLDTGRAAEALAEVTRSAHLDRVGAEHGELSVHGPEDFLGQMIIDVACASLRLDELRWLASHRAPVQYRDRLARRVENWAGERWDVRRDAPIRLRSGRNRKVTLAVQSGQDVAYVQALSTRDLEAAAEHCYYIFDLSQQVPRSHKIAALDGTSTFWPREIVSELKTVSEVRFFEEPSGLERSLDRVLVAHAAPPIDAEPPF